MLQHKTKTKPKLHPHPNIMNQWGDSYYSHPGKRLSVQTARANKCFEMFGNYKHVSITPTSPCICFETASKRIPANDPTPTLPQHQQSFMQHRQNQR